MRAVCVAVHDVAPDTWARCERLLALLDELACPAVTLLAVPHYHHLRRMVDAPDVVRAIDARLARGAEVVLHGYYHLDEAGAAKSAREWLRRSFLTAGEGEFEALTQAQARVRIERGLAEFAHLGWPIEGFVPPAWLAGAGTLPALRTTPLRYLTTHQAFCLVREGTAYRAPCFTASTRAGWRRVMTAAATAGLRRITQDAPVVRVALHPADVQHEAVMAMWRALLTQLLLQREPLTKAAAVQRLHNTARLSAAIT